MRRIMASSILLAAVLLLCSCAMLPGGRLESRAADYYNYMAGKQAGKKYSSYLSPAHRGAMDRADLRALDEAKDTADKSNERYPDAKAADVSVSTESHFAYTMVNPELGDAFANQPPVKWVKAGMRWYVYMGSEAEVQKYGPFPASLSPREPPGPEGQAVP